MSHRVTSRAGEPPNFRTLFESVPGLYLVVEPDAPRYTIVAMSHAYAAATMTKRDEILGRGVFEVFPDNPASTTGVGVVRASFERVIRDRAPDTIGVQKYDIRRPEEAGGGFEERWWTIVNAPVFGPDGELIYIANRAEDVTEYVHLKQAGFAQRELMAELHTKTAIMESEIFKRGQELHAVNHQLRSAYEEITHLFEKTKQAEDALRTSEAKFAGVISIASDAIVSIDENQRIVMYNEGAEHMFGWKREDVLGKSVDVLIPERFHGVHQQHLRNFAAQASKSRRMGERRMILGVRANGDEFPADAAISKLDVGGGWLFTIVARDISEQKRAEAEQRLLLEVGTVLASTFDYEEILDKLAALVVNAVSDCCIVDLVEAGQLRRLKVVHRDPQKAEIVRTLDSVPVDPQRRNASDALDAPAPILVSAVTPEDLVAVAQSADQLRALRDLAPTSLMSLPLVAHGQLLGALILARTGAAHPFETRDLQLGQELAHRAALAVEHARLDRNAQRAIAARDDVLGVVAHDLRNPLNTILLQTELLGSREPERRAQRPAETIGRAANRMDRLIQDLLDVARLQEGRLTVVCDRVRSEALIREVVEMQKPLASKSSLTLNLEFAAELPDTWGDRDRILQVLDNLIGNAVKFTESGGRITVGATPLADEVLFWVADTGTGIRPESIPHLFDRFWQARNADRRGTGLGLAISKGIVEAHRGRIWAESRLGVGSVFSFTIPAVPSTNLVAHDHLSPVRERRQNLSDHDVAGGGSPFEQLR